MTSTKAVVNDMAHRIGIAATEYASIARSIGNLDAQRSTYRDELARTFIRAGIDMLNALPVGQFNPKTFRSMFNAAARDAVRAEFSKETVREYDSFDGKALAARLTMHTDRNPSFKHADVADLARALNVLKVRLSESFRVFKMYIDGEQDTIGALMDGDISVHAILDGLRTIEGKDSGKDGETDGEDDATSTYDLVKFQARIAAELKHAEKAGFLPDAMKSIAEMVGTLAAK